MGIDWGTTCAMHSVRLNKRASTIVVLKRQGCETGLAGLISSRINRSAHPAKPRLSNWRRRAIHEQPVDPPRYSLRLARAFMTIKMWFRYGAEVHV